jgi:undecaprenyl-diphosphatase
MYARFKAFDERATEYLRLAERSSFLRSACVFFAHSGDSWFWLIGLGLLWQVGGPFWRSRVITMLIGIAVTALVVMIIKFTVRRRRPEGSWGRIYRSTDPHSFPSGHAARAAMLAVLSLGTGPIWFALIITAWAPLVGLARVIMGVHYFSDIAAGTVLGLFLGALLLVLI